jgi:hypothetical protein
MDHADALEVLAVAAAFDRRTVGEADGMAWSMALPEVGMQPAKDAVIAHYRVTTDWVMPAHVLQIVRDIRNDRLRNMELPVPPRELADNWNGEMFWTARYRDVIVEGGTVAEARAYANEQLNIVEDDAPLALEAIPTGSLREALDRAERGRQDGIRLAQIAEEATRRVEEKARADRAAEVAGSEKRNDEDAA